MLSEKSPSWPATKRVVSTVGVVEFKIDPALKSAPTRGSSPSDSSVMATPKQPATLSHETSECEIKCEALRLRKMSRCRSRSPGAPFVHSSATRPCRRSVHRTSQCSSSLAMWYLRFHSAAPAGCAHQASKGCSLQAAGGRVLGACCACEGGAPRSSSATASHRARRHISCKKRNL